MLTLCELSTVEAELFVVASVASFVDDLVESGADLDAATAATDDHMRRLLPDGVRTQGHRFTSIEADGREVGRLWFGPVPDSAGDWYLFEVDVDQDQRGHGLGRAALAAVIGELAGSNSERLGLNVFDSNTAAVALYVSLGFTAVDDNNGHREMWLELRNAR